MILFNVILKPTDHVFELVPIQIANEAFVFFVRVLGSLVVSQLCECINDNTKNNIHENNVDNQETGHIIGKPHEKPSLVITFVTLPQ